MQLALKIDVDTFRGTRVGVPTLVELLSRMEAQATFLFSLGPDHTGRALKRAFRPGFMQKVSRTSVLEHYGLKTLLYGTLLPGPDIGRRCIPQMRSVRDAGHEVGVHTWDHVRWQDGVVDADAAWTEHEIAAATVRFEQVFGVLPKVHGAAGWQMNRHAFRLLQRSGYAYASDTRGTHPFLPVWNAETTLVPQFPTTLPTLDELIGVDGVTVENVADTLLARTARDQRPLEVFTLHAELEGMKLAPVLERLLAGWRAQGYSLVTLRDVAASVETKRLPHHVVTMASVPGRSGRLATQGPAFLPAQAESTTLPT